MKHLVISVLSILCFGCLYSNAQRVNADGRKLVKTVRSYVWSSRINDYKLDHVYTMEYNSENELVNLTHYKCNGFEPVTYTRKGNVIFGQEKNLSECKYQLDPQGKIISGEIHEYSNGKIPNPDIYYMTLSFDYNEEGQLSLLTEKYFYHRTGKKYKENPEDRIYRKFEYKNGGTYVINGLINIKGEECFFYIRGL